MQPFTDTKLHKDKKKHSTMPVPEDEVAVVRCGTSAGKFAMKFTRTWSPHGYDRAVALFEKGYYDNSHFFRVVPDFLVQFGISYTNSEMLKNFAESTILDDPQWDPPIKFKAGTISFAGSGDNSRTSHLFISYGGTFGSSPWETPVGEVVEGMENVRNFYSYGDMPPWGEGPEQGKIYSGRRYIEDKFPLTDNFLKCTVERESKSAKRETEQQQMIKDPPKVGATAQQNELGKAYLDAGSDTSSTTGILAVLVLLSAVVVAMVSLGRKKKGSKVR